MFIIDLVQKLVSLLLQIIAAGCRRGVIFLEELERRATGSSNEWPGSALESLQLPAAHKVAGIAPELPRMQAPELSEVGPTLLTRYPQNGLKAPRSGRQMAYEDEKQRAVTALRDLFPPDVADAMLNGKRAPAKHVDVATVVFMDVVGFTSVCSGLTSWKIANMLNRLYCKFDALAVKHGVYKVETIGDCYVGVTNLIADQAGDHVRRIANFTREAIEVASTVLVDEADESKGTISVRGGFSCGPLTGDVVGLHGMRYCIFGDVVNVAARMESSSVPGRLLCSDHAAKLLREQDPEVHIQPCGVLPIKGKGAMSTHWVF